MQLVRSFPGTLLQHPASAAIQRIVQRALEAVDPYAAVTNAVQVEAGCLHLGQRLFVLSQYQRLIVVGAGKAGAPMTAALTDLLAPLKPEGLVVVKDGHAGVDHYGAVKLLPAAHPVPDQRGLAAARQIQHLLAQTTAADLVIVLLSGGGSALLPAPLPGLSLAHLQQLTSALLACGASIDELNMLRKHLDSIKGGGLARQAAPAQVIALLLSDVIGNREDVIASGPTSPDPSTYAQAFQVLEQYGLLAQVPQAVRDHLELGLAGYIPETPKPGDALFDRVYNQVIASNGIAAGAALQQAAREGYYPLLLTTYLQGEASQAGRFLAAFARQIAATGQPVARPACLLAGGETTVTVRGSGLGGRNQELALGAVSDLAGLENTLLLTLATDGGDGPTPAAGAAVSGATLARAAQLGLSVTDFLRRNDSFNFFDRLGDLLITGPTQTNVNDLTFLFIG